jgi:hypothetical protein
LPLPFSRVAISIGEPVGVPRGFDPDALARLQKTLGETLLALKASGYAALGKRPAESGRYTAAK